MNVNDSDRSVPPNADDALDTRARQAHAASLDALSPRVYAQLRQRRRAASTGERSRAGMRWVPTLAVAATLVLASVLGLRLLWPSASDIESDIALAGDAASPSIDASDGAASDTSSARTDAHATATRDTRIAAIDDGTAIETNVGESGLGVVSDGANADTNAEREIDAMLAMFERTDEADVPDAFEQAPNASDDDALLASLEESPDFYLWLSADDGADVEAL